MIRLRDFFSDRSRQRRQQQAPFEAKVFASDEVLAALKTLFEGRCAFCETSARERGQVVHLRPTAGAMELTGSTSPDHYWWLAYDWNNLYLSCPDCAKAKGSRFPVRAPRAAPEGRGNKLREEFALLIDPCVPFDPHKHFHYLPSGVVEGLTDEGRTTIDVFGLNRPALVSERHKRIGRARTIARRMLQRRNPTKTPDRLFLRQFGRRFEHEPFVAAAEEEARRVLQIERKIPPQLRRRVTVADRLRSLASGPTWLQKVEIENFRALEHLTLEFPSVDSKWAQENLDHPDQEPWIVLLGNNGVGKSTVLKAIALALATPRQRERAAPDPRTLVTRGRGQRKGRVRLWLTDRTEPLELVFGDGRRGFTLSGLPGNVPLLAYGATRILPPMVRRNVPRIERARIGNLFSPNESLTNGERWLADGKLVSPDNFNLLSRALKHLLQLDEREFVTRKRQRLFAKLFRKELEVRELSDGFQSVLALALDMMRNLSHVTHDMGQVEGLVLLDEIEVHLHPTWKVRIVRDLRKIFRRTRFIVTTHDPLCLQGLAPGELHIMSRNEKSKRVVVQQTDIPPGLRADQILTGEWFGLGSTRDPDTLRLMERHSQLLLVRQPTAPDRAERLTLEQTLRARLGHYADSPYERAALQAYAELAPQRNDVPLQEQHDLIQKRVRELLPLDVPIQKPS